MRHGVMDNECPIERLLSIRVVNKSTFTKRHRITKSYEEEGGNVDRISSTFEPQRKWDGEGYEEGCDPKEKAKIMEKLGDRYSGRTVAKVNKLAYQDTSEGKQD
ncbi:hypothetical protein DVH24_038059 [Malus domestica]|uniref:Uncharacterized protein n=1 Tax=Malus domestica TaxID=3750 RepID=A0A498KD89_MALDO|nr:hypothetical protein DVH24_038059 [Malus domestica]